MKMPFGLDEFSDSLPQTEDSAERGYVPAVPGTTEPVSYRDLGRSEADDDVGDIADEGRGHRG
jgi:hypothetical protein